MSDPRLDLIPQGKTFSPAEITHYADPDTRSLTQAIDEADLLVTAPHAGAAIPAELAEFLTPALTRRLQYDFSDVSTAAVVRRWAEIDPRIIAVVNPHPRLIRDPNRAKPDDIRATLTEAIRLVRAAGSGNPVDLTGVDAIRPVTFSFFPIIEIPDSDEAIARLVDAFVATAERGLGVYETTRDDLTAEFIARGLERGGSFTRLSFHDTMNTTTTPDGAVAVPRPASDRLPPVVALSNRGDHRGESRGAEDPPTMRPAALRALAEAHRIGFEVEDPSAVQLNHPYLGSQEIRAAGEQFRAVADEARAAGLSLDAVQAEFLREFLLGPEATAQLHEPGTEWVQEDPQRIEMLAFACKRAWDEYREK